MVPGLSPQRGWEWESLSGGPRVHVPPEPKARSSPSELRKGRKRRREKKRIKEGEWGGGIEKEKR